MKSVALAKAREVAVLIEAGTILSGDTMVEVDGEILGKPTDPADARSMLRKLSGATHRVHTGVAVIHVPTGLERTGVETTSVTMRSITEAELNAYVDSGEPMGKAGSYAVQETGDRFVTALEGPYDNVVGLPLALVENLLQHLAQDLP